MFLLIVWRNNDDISSYIGQNFSMAQVEELCSNSASTDSLEQIQNVVMFLYNSEGLAKHVDSFMKILALMDLKDGASAILAPFLPDNLPEASLPGYFHCFYVTVECLIGCTLFCS